jgi:hypothetical protein
MTVASISRRSDLAERNAGRPKRRGSYRGRTNAAARRAPAAVRITREGRAWLVGVGAHGWLHGDEASALGDARWLSQNFGLPIRRDDREGDV